MKTPSKVEKYRCTLVYNIYGNRRELIDPGLVVYACGEKQKRRGEEAKKRSGALRAGFVLVLVISVS